MEYKFKEAVSTEDESLSFLVSALYFILVPEEKPRQPLSKRAIHTYRIQGVTSLLVLSSEALSTVIEAEFE